jgi:hypothetical protein
MLNFIAKVGREDILKLAIGNEGSHEIGNKLLSHPKI